MDLKFLHSKMNAVQAATEQTTDRFRELFQGLPAELKGMIYEHTFSAGPTVQKITQDYKPPPLLQIDRATRIKFAKLYFSLTTFKLSSHTILRQWLVSLEPEHVATVSKIHFDISDSGEATTEKKTGDKGRSRKRRALQRSAEERKSYYSQMMKAEARLFFLRSYLLRYDVRLKPRVIYVNVRFNKIGWEEWTPDPGLSFKNWKVEQLRRGEVEQFERDLKAGRTVIKARN